MKIYFTGNTGFNTAQRESEVLPLLKKRLHSFWHIDGLKNTDVMECFRMKAKQIGDTKTVKRFRIMIDVVIEKNKK